MGNYASHNQQRFLPSDTNDTSQESMETDEYPQPKIKKIFMCVPTPGYEKFFRTYIPIFDILLVAVIPFFLLCFTNIGIIAYTMRTNRRMRQHRKRAHRRHQRLTIMLLSVTLAFIGLTCPSVIFICVNKIIYSIRLQTDKKTGNLNELVSISPPSNVQLILDVCEALWYTKHAMNFILYTLSGQDFRREFIKLFTQCFHNRPSILKNFINPTQTRSEPTNNSSLIEIPIVIDSNHWKKTRKSIMNDHNIPSTVSLITKTTTNTMSNEHNIPSTVSLIKKTTTSTITTTHSI